MKSTNSPWTPDAIRAAKPFPKFVGALDAWWGSTAGHADHDSDHAVYDGSEPYLPGLLPVIATSAQEQKGPPKVQLTHPADLRAWRLVPRGITVANRRSR